VLLAAVQLKLATCKNVEFLSEMCSCYMGLCSLALEHDDRLGWEDWKELSSHWWKEKWTKKTTGCQDF